MVRMKRTTEWRVHTRRQALGQEFHRDYPLLPRGEAQHTPSVLVAAYAFLVRH